MRPETHITSHLKEKNLFPTFAGKFKGEYPTREFIENSTRNQINPRTPIRTKLYTESTLGCEFELNAIQNLP